MAHDGNGNGSRAGAPPSDGPETLAVALLCAPVPHVLFPGTLLKVPVQDSAALIRLLSKGPLSTSLPGSPTPRRPLLGVVALAPSRSSLGNSTPSAETPQAEHGALSTLDAASLSAIPQPTDPARLFRVGCLARILSIQHVKALSFGSDKRGSIVKHILTLEGMSRMRLEPEAPERDADVLSVVTLLPDNPLDSQDPEVDSLLAENQQGIQDLSDTLLGLALPAPLIRQLRDLLSKTSPSRLPDLIACNVDTTYVEKLALLETLDVKDRLRQSLRFLKRQTALLQVSSNIQSTVSLEQGKKVKESLLRQKMAAIQRELGDSGSKGEDDELKDLETRLGACGLPEPASKTVFKDLKRLQRMNPNMSDYQVLRNYLELVADLPWSKSSSDTLNLSKARSQLDQDHFGLEKIKTRILSFLAVKKLAKNSRGPILCLVGPPGVGKTSLGKSIAASMGRTFHRVALGGVRDEAEIRGHRRTYVGAMPGLFISGLQKCRVNNPVFLLDEVDKIGKDWKGDPAAALLEVLDPEQNEFFSDHYLNTPFDLSNVLFIATANDAEAIPEALLDRMEVIQLSGYTYVEKEAIGRRFLLPKQLSLNGLTPGHLTLSDESLMTIITDYTRESGVRNLEREIGGVCRHVAVQVAEAQESKAPLTLPIAISSSSLRSILGPPTYTRDDEDHVPVPGIVTGMAWTKYGGGLLWIESSVVRGKGNLQLTGSLGDVIKESAQLAVTWIRANADALGISSSRMAAVLSGLSPASSSQAPRGGLLDDLDLHIHFPAGAVPKDGPSAGITILISLVSLFTQTPVRPHLAMTGEISLKGRVLPVGGIKEKVLAAHRGGITTVLLPQKNFVHDVQEDKDFEQVSEKVRREVNLVGLETVWDAIRVAFDGKLEPRQSGHPSPPNPGPRPPPLALAHL